MSAPAIDSRPLPPCPQESLSESAGYRHEAIGVQIAGESRPRFGRTDRPIAAGTSGRDGRAPTARATGTRDITGSAVVRGRRQSMWRDTFRDRLPTPSAFRLRCIRCLSIGQMRAPVNRSARIPFAWNPRKCRCFPFSRLAATLARNDTCSCHQSPRFLLLRLLDHGRSRRPASRHGISLRPASDDSAARRPPPPGAALPHADSKLLAAG